MDQYGLTLESSGHYNGYDINMNPGTANSVAAAALQFVSSLLPHSLSVVDDEGRETGQQDLAGTAFAPFALYDKGGLDRVLQGLIHGPAQVEDNHINEVMKVMLIVGKTVFGNTKFNWSLYLSDYDKPYVPRRTSPQRIGYGCSDCSTGQRSWAPELCEMEGILPSCSG